MPYFGAPKVAYDVTPDQMMNVIGVIMAQCDPQARHMLAACLGSIISDVGDFDGGYCEEFTDYLYELAPFTGRANDEPEDVVNSRIAREAIEAFAVHIFEDCCTKPCAKDRRIAEEQKRRRRKAEKGK